MKILIVDDDADKLRKLISVITDSGVDRTAIDVVRSAAEARRRLQSNSYEIAVLDLMLPHNDEDPPRIESSLDLLRELSERDDYLKPERLIGFTAFSEAASRAQPYFLKTLWTIVLYDETTNDWEEQFRRVIKYITGRSRVPAAAYDVDLCVVTALQHPELSAVHRIPWEWEPPEPMDDTTFIRRGKFQSEGREFRVMSACAGRMGNVAAALLSAKLISFFRPRFLVMAGICGGVREKVNLGDVVLFSPCWEWASGKIVSDDAEGSYLEPAPHQVPISEFIRARADELRKDRVAWLEIQSKFTEEFDVLPKLVIAPGASGPSVIAQKDYAEAIRVQHRKLTAIDMEAYGVSAAANFASSPRPTTFVMKSVSDYADEEKDDSMQAYAAYTSARAIQTFFERYMNAIYRLAGT